MEDDSQSEEASDDHSAENGNGVDLAASGGIDQTRREELRFGKGDDEEMNN